MRPQRVGAIVLRQLYLLRGSPARVLPLFAWVAVDVVLWGFITRYLDQVSAARFDFVPMLLGAVLLWDFLTRVMHGVTMAFFEDVWSRNFLNLFATPLTIVEYVTGLVVTSVMTSVVGRHPKGSCASCLVTVSRATPSQPRRRHNWSGSRTRQATNPTARATPSTVKSLLPLPLVSADDPGQLSGFPEASAPGARIHLDYAASFQPDQKSPGRSAPS